MKKLIFLCGMLSLLSLNSAYGVNYFCPQYSGNLTYGESGTFQTPETWRVWMQANQLSVNTGTDQYYSAAVEPQPPLPDGTAPANSQLSCTGGWTPDGNYILYSFSTLVPFKECLPTTLPSTTPNAPTTGTNNQLEIPAFICQ